MTFGKIKADRGSGFAVPKGKKQSSPGKGSYAPNNARFRKDRADHIKAWGAKPTGRTLNVGGMIMEEFRNRDGSLSYVWALEK